MLNNIEAERVRNSFTKEDMAKKLGISLKTYYNWINQETDMPISFLVKMAEIFGTTTDYLLEGFEGVDKKVVAKRAV